MSGMSGQGYGQPSYTPNNGFMGQNALGQIANQGFAVGGQQWPSDSGQAPSVPNSGLLSQQPNVSYANGASAPQSQINSWISTFR